MKFFRLFILCIFFLTHSNNGHAQSVWKKGYVLLTNGDTFKGEIRLNPKMEFDMYSRVIVKKSEEERKTFNPIKAKEFVAGDVKFISRPVEGENSFVKCLSLGAINLYEHQYEWQSGNAIIHKSEYFIERANSAEMVKVKSGRFKKIVDEYMGDYAALMKDVRDKKYDFEQLSEIVQLYNTWAKTQKG